MPLFKCKVDGSFANSPFNLIYVKAVTVSPDIAPPSTSSPAISAASNTTTSRPAEQTSKRPVASSTFVPRKLILKLSNRLVVFQLSTPYLNAVTYL